MAFDDRLGNGGNLGTLAGCDVQAVGEVGGGVCSHGCLASTSAAGIGCG
ncbi:hypothetical protein ACFPRL_35740 [Pseudoclavibacter helvolus]